MKKITFLSGLLILTLCMPAIAQNNTAWLFKTISDAEEGSQITTSNGDINNVVSETIAGGSLNTKATLYNQIW